MRSIRVLTSFLLVLTFILTGCDSGTSDEGEIIITELTPGTGVAVQNQQTIIISWEGRLVDGTVFDSSDLQGQDLIFTLGVGKVIKGLDEGIVGMKVGGSRQIEIPPSKAFGRAGSCPESGNCIVPSNSTVIYTVELKDRLDYVIIDDQVEGSGAEAVEGDLIHVDYVGATTNGTVFDASEQHGGPLEFRLGAGHVIDGWDLGVPGMKVGGVRFLTIPPELGYGGFKNGRLPEWSVMIFRVELVHIVDES